MTLIEAVIFVTISLRFFKPKTPKLLSILLSKTSRILHKLQKIINNGKLMETEIETLRK